MNTGTKQILFWTPRILCILFAMFLSIFAFDVFDEGRGIGETILALLIHLPEGIDDLFFPLAVPASFHGIRVLF